MLRVIAWGTGAVGREMLTAIIDHRHDMRIVGARVYSADKNGVDVGTLAGRDPIGVAATTDVDDILALDADCVLYTPRLARLDEVCALLGSGKNVVTTAFLFHPHRIPPADRDRLATACKTGGTSIHGSGLNPGNLSGVLPLALSGMSRTIDKITLQERADWSVYESTSITFDNMAFGQPVDRISPTASEFLAFNSSIFENQVWFLADELNAGIDEVVTEVDAVPAREDHQIFEHLLRAGTTAGQRWTWSGRRDGETLIEIEALWTVGGEYPPHWPKPEHGWTLTIEGDPSMRAHFFALASFTRAADMAEHVRSASVATAMQVLNAVPAVCAAPAGFATSAVLPLVRSHTGFGNSAVRLDD
ncbi:MULTISPECIES: dihydrodipicolinate reductase [unclassified Mycobacterium]|uniref:NAD(P)H-dependent amine dehydrogenase family protein n=1 Tax=unclassified Mycobacterium TaxID=2642494 RepID=UPI00274182CC|nr:MULTISPECIES: dihydrodipicolinate reductase [unclassified Mycobacterium]MDP7703287.1 dihydrodipicolinate reductase [Mycobacterium sp. TY815]MDP7721695.1 dihydrodipicolinate reductase [Mycobacterium sp. TY814]